MEKSIGMLEFNSIAAGIEAADVMCKTAAVELIFASSTCPGKYLAMIAGEVAAVKSSIEAGKEIAYQNLADYFVIPNVDPSVISAITGTTQIQITDALGVIETMSAASCIEAADAAVKAAGTDLIEIRLPTGLGGKSYCTMTGSVSSVESSVEAGIETVKERGLLLGKVVIPSPHCQLMEKIR